VTVSSHPPSPPPRPPARRHRLWRDLREAVAGSDQDFTTGGMRRAILLLAVPMMLEMVMESLFAIVDVFFVSKLGPDAVTTVGLTDAVLTLVFAVAIGLSMPATAMVARRIGEKDREAAARTAFQVLVVGVAVSAAVGLFGVFFAASILGWMGGSPAVVAQGSAYTAVILGGSATVLLLFLLNAVFRGAGDAAIAMRVLWVANSINIVLDPCLIFGLGPFPELGLTGAAVATTIGRGVGVALQLWVLLGGKGRIALARRHMRLDLSILARLLRLSAGGILQYLVATCSWVVVVRILAVFGSTVVAGYTIAVRIVVFTILPSWGLSNAAATLVGQNLGAGRPRRAELSVWLTARYNLYFLAAVSAVFLLMPRPLVALFTEEPAVVAMGVDTLRWIASCYLPWAYGVVMLQAFNGAGDTWTPTWINLVCYWLFQLPLAWYLAQPFGLGPHGVLLSLASGETLVGVAGILMFRLGRWKKRQV